jgi:hypothetical protein
VVRLSQPFGLCQLFRPIAKNSAARPTLNETYEYGNDLTLGFSAREALAAPEQTLLLVLLELAEEQYRRRPVEHRLDQTDRTEIGLQLWSSLHEATQSSVADAPATLMLSCSWSELHRRCGSTSTGGAITESRRASLVRLCEVTVWEKSQATKTVRSGRLVSWLVGDDLKIHVALNHRLALALLSPGYAQILLSERLQLKSHTAMLVHAFLSTCLGRNKTMFIGYETLVERLWPSRSGPTPASTHRRRLSDVRSALRAVGRLGNWRVELGTTTTTVTRTMTGQVTARESAPDINAVTSATKGSSKRPVREMTRVGHFGAPSMSYTERPFWKSFNADVNLPRYDEPSNSS